MGFLKNVLKPKCKFSIPLNISNNIIKVTPNPQCTPNPQFSKRC